jgi:phage shock protein PspC (stress-responsive transcriptional regulator)
MKKTVSVNIKGMNFLIEEDAYDLLQDYMNRLNHGLRNEKDSKEIIEDIEMRIAELCTSRLNEKKQVIEIEDIQLILDTLGDPSQYIDEEEGEFKSSAQTFDQKSSDKGKERRLFRDVENATIAGVCSGISNYFGIDVTIIRIIFLVVFFFGGFGFPLYIILWIVVPKAKSTIEKLQMRGKPITVDSVKEEVENAAKRFESETKNMANKFREDGHWSQRFNSIGRIIASLIGVFLIIKGLFFLVLFMIFGVIGVRVIPVQSEFGYLSLPELAHMTMETQSDYIWGYVGIILTALSIVFFLILLGIKMIFSIRNQWSRMSLISLFIIGFVGSIIILIIGLKTGRELTINGEMERKIGTYYGNQLILKPHLSTYESQNNYQVKSDGDWGMLGIKGDRISRAGIQLHFKQSGDTLFHIYQNIHAQSHSHSTALKKAKNIRHSIAIEGNTVHLNNFFTYPLADKLRLQDVEIYVEIPSGKSVRINNKVIRLSKDSISDQKMDSDYEQEGEIQANGSYSHWD